MDKLSEEEKQAIDFFEKSFKKKIPPYWYDDTISNIEGKIKTILNLIEKQQKELEQEKEKNKELEKQYKILEVEKVRYNIFYLESDISQTPDTAMVYYSMKKHLETLKEEKIKLEAELQELLEYFLNEIKENGINYFCKNIKNKKYEEAENYKK